jgi:polar amino acid transport system substrate-binding protein
MSIDQAMGTLPDRRAAHAYLDTFIENVKRSGFIAQALASNGQSDLTIAPLRA